VEGTRLRPDGTLRDAFNLPRGYWEAKDTDDDLDTEIRRKTRKGYPLTNILFEDSRRAVLYQNKRVVMEADVRDVRPLANLLTTFLRYEEPDHDAFDTAMQRFGEVIPDLAAGLMRRIAEERRDSERFRSAFAEFFELCQATLNPQIKPEVIDEMLAQHLLTERLFRTIFDNPDFVQRNVIAREIEKVIEALTSRSFNRSDFTRTLDPFYVPIEREARNITDWSQRQAFLNLLYERFFQDFSRKAADTQGIVYTPQEIVDFMCASVDDVLKSEFGLSLSSPGVCILDPCVGTGNFVVNLIRRIEPMQLRHKYERELFCNENMLLPYYIACLNIEHAYYERAGEYRPFEGICFADTLDLAKGQQLAFFAEANSDRVEREKQARITVILGNPPYNVGQQNENDNNKNRKYPVVDARVSETYARDSKATNRKALSDAYVKFFRWATDRLNGQPGIVCFVSNNGYLNGVAFDGFRKHLAREFDLIYHLNLKGNARTAGEQRRAEGGNIFNDQVRAGIGITILLKTTATADLEQNHLLYHVVDDYLTAAKKKDCLKAFRSASSVPWHHLKPSEKHAWINDGLQSDYMSFLPIGTKDVKSGRDVDLSTVFKRYGGGVKTNRDLWMTDFSAERLKAKVSLFVETYMSDLSRWNLAGGKQVDIDAFVSYDDRKIKWSRDLKQDLSRGAAVAFDDTKMRRCLYRPFSSLLLYFDRILNEEVYINPSLFPSPQQEAENVSICLTDIGSAKPFMTLASASFADLHLVGAGASAQCFPMYVYNPDGTNRRENITDWALAQFRAAYGEGVTRRDIFHYVYAVLHHPDYRARYAENLKRELPRIPLVPDPETFRALAAAGERLAELHVGYEQQPEYPLQAVCDPKTPLTELWTVSKMRLSADRTAVVVSERLTLAGIPPEAHRYRLGNRSALEWIIDQYRVRTDKRSGITLDPNRRDDPEYIVRLIGRVVTVSVETVKVVESLPPLGLPAG
jgi:predicted helicase